MSLRYSIFGKVATLDDLIQKAKSREAASPFNVNVGFKHKPTWNQYGHGYECTTRYRVDVSSNDDDVRVCSRRFFTTPYETESDERAKEGLYKGLQIARRLDDELQAHVSINTSRDPYNGEKSYKTTDFDTYVNNFFGLMRQARDRHAAAFAEFDD